MSTHERTTGVFKRIFGDSDLVLISETVAADVEGWDSLAHIQLIVALEKEFKVKFKASEITGFKNVGELIQILDQKMNTSP